MVSQLWYIVVIVYNQYLILWVINRYILQWTHQGPIEVEYGPEIAGIFFTGWGPPSYVRWFISSHETSSWNIYHQPELIHPQPYLNWTRARLEAPSCRVMVISMGSKTMAPWGELRKRSIHIPYAWGPSIPFPATPMKRNTPRVPSGSRQTTENPLSHATKILPVSSAPWAAIGISEGHFPDSSPSSTIWAPPVIIVINTINHSYWTYFHQLSYRTGGLTLQHPGHFVGREEIGTFKDCILDATLRWRNRSNLKRMPPMPANTVSDRTAAAIMGTFSLIPPSGQTWLAGRLSHLVPFRNILKLPLNIFHVLLFLSNRFSMFFHIVLCFFACCGLGLRPMTRS